MQEQKTKKFVRCKDRSGKRQAVMDGIRNVLESNHMYLLPSERELAERFTVNRITVQRALRELEMEGTIKKLPHRGYIPMQSRSRIRHVKDPDKARIGFPLWATSIAHVDFLRAPYTFHVLHGVQEIIHAQGHELDVQFIGPRANPDTDLIRRLNTEWDGMISLTPQDKDPRQGVFAELFRRTVFIDYGQHVTENRVAADVFGGTRLAAQTLIDNGAKRILYTGRANDHMPVCFARLTGVEEAVECNRGVSLLCGRGGWFIEDGYSTVSQAVQGGEKFDAILCTSDYAAVGALRACHDHQLSVPNEVQVMGFGGFPFTKYLTPSLTTIDCDIEELGRAAARMMVRLLQENGKPQPALELPVRLIQGDTTRNREASELTGRTQYPVAANSQVAEIKI